MEICGYYGIPKSEKYYEYQPEPITEAKEATILLDFKHGRKIKWNRSDIVINDYERKTMSLKNKSIQIRGNRK